MELLENIPLAPYTSLRIGGPARYFAEAQSESDVLWTLRWARHRNVPVFVLGGGSNLLVSDAGFTGLVLRVAIGGVEQRDEGGRRVYTAGAGVEWDRLVAQSVAEGCAGIECLSGIPGTVGGTPVQNVGAYGQEVSETIVQVRAIDRTSLEVMEFTAARCGFGYRSSRFNGAEREGYLITRVSFGLLRGGPPRLAYAELQRRFEGVETPTLEAVRTAVLELRRSKGMVLDDSDLDTRSAGSFFKNPMVSPEELAAICQSSGMEANHFATSDGKIKLSAAWLIEHSGIPRGFALGRASLSSKHTLALVNRFGDARSEDLLRLRDFVRLRVQACFGVELQQEPVMLGFE